MPGSEWRGPPEEPTAVIPHGGVCEERGRRRPRLLGQLSMSTSQAAKTKPFTGNLMLNVGKGKA
jgi:hypothetical protein